MASRNTVQQKIIAQQLRELGNHPTADEVYQAVRRQLPSVSKATVYRTLNKLVDAGQATCVIAGTGAERFDYRTDEHCHVACIECGKVEDVCAGAFDDGVNRKAVAAACGYEILGHNLVFDGICPACQQGR